MQRANCTVKLGSLGNTVAKTNVSPAEAAVLIAMHGEGSVVDVQPTHQDKTPHSQERSRLRTTYGEHVVDRLFPGEFSRLPVSFAEIKFGNEDEDGEKAEGEGEEEGEGDKAEGDKPGAGVSGQVGELGAVDEDDQQLVDLIKVANSKQALRDIAKENEIDLSDVADKMDPLRAQLLTRLFPGKAV